MLARSASSEIPQLLVAALSLAAVLLLIAAIAWLLRRAPGLLPAAAPQCAVLHLRATLRLDPRRRLYLVEAEGHQALVLTGGASETIVPLPPPGA